jgi:hypothetical protein
MSSNLTDGMSVVRRPQRSDQPQEVTSDLLTTAADHFLISKRWIQGVVTPLLALSSLI